CIHACCGPTTRRYCAPSDFLVLSAIPTLNFAASFIYVAAAPTYLGRSFGLSTYGFAWFFVPLISGIMTGVVFLGQLAGRLSPNRTIRIGYACMSRAHFSISWLLHSLRRMCLGTYCHYFVFTMGTSFVIPSVTLLPLGLFPAMRGLASSLAGFVQFAFSGSTQARSRHSLRIRSRRSQALRQLSQLQASRCGWCTDRSQ